MAVRDRAIILLVQGAKVSRGVDAKQTTHTHTRRTSKA